MMLTFKTKGEYNELGLRHLHANNQFKLIIKISSTDSAVSSGDSYYGAVKET